MRNILTAAALVAGMATAQAAPVDAIRAGDIDLMIDTIVAVYEDAGLSWDHRIEWEKGPFTTTFWYYSSIEDKIVVGAIPRDDQVEAYWQAWSQVLTDGNFDPAGFFASPVEARDLARFNQYVLATHEAAHAMTYRYDYAHLERHAHAINCREYYADRLTVAILNEEASREPDMARWRDRYRDLVTAMGDTIPEQYRYHIPDFAALEADCALIDVAQPTPQTMQPYASAYFERYRVLLEADGLPPLDQVLETHLAARWEEARGNLRFAPERATIEVATVGELDEMELGTVYFGIDDARIGSRAAAVAPDGTLWFANLVYDPATRMAELAFGTEPEAGAPIAEPSEWTHPSRNLQLTSLAVLSPDRFVIALDHWDEEGPDGAERHFVTWILATRAAEVWTRESLAEIETGQGVALRAPDGRIYLLATIDEPSRVGSENWRGLEVSLDTGEVLGEIELTSPFTFPMAIDAEGRLYEEVSYLLWRTTPGAGDDVLLGTGLVGPRDGSGDRAEMSDLKLMQWMPDGRALLVERGLTFDRWLIRELRPVPAAP